MARANTQMRMPEPWMRRLYLPAYSVRDAARFARVHANTVAYWHYGPHDTKSIPGRPTLKPTLPGKEKRRPLSYLQLIEVAVVATFRKMGVDLKIIREAHDYCAQHLSEEFPFAHYSFATDGVELVLGMADIIPKADINKLVVANRYGQLGWKKLIGERFSEFVYEHDLATLWNVGGQDFGEVVINPRVAFGAPTVDGTPTWALKGRYDARESIEDICDDFGLDKSQVIQALRFEGVKEDLEAA